MSATINIDELQVGMFVHLDLGWWAHPFARSSFQIQSADQIETIRGLGLARVRWSPERSVPADAVGEDAATPHDATAAPPPAAVQGPAAEPAPAATSTSTSTPTPASPVGSDAPTAAAPTSTPAPAGATVIAWPSPPPPSGTRPPSNAATPAAAGALSATPPPPAAQPADRPATAPASAHERALQSQREALQRCQQRYSEAGDACANALRTLLDAPEQALQTCTRLTDDLLSQLLAEGEVSVRVLAQGHDDPAAAHALNVSLVAMLLGRAQQLSPAQLQCLGRAALLHDIGKLELPERAHAAECLSHPAELALYRDHVAHGLVLGRRMGLDEDALQILTQHHELDDGSGFPQHMRGPQIHPLARIVAIVDRYDRLCNPARPALAITPHEALSLMFSQCRNQFDAPLLSAFIRMMGVYPPGSCVQLSDERYASVISVNASRPLKPSVLVCELDRSPDDALIVDLDREPNGLTIRRSLKPAALPAAVRDWLSPRPRMVYFFEPGQRPAPQPGDHRAAA
ncbi:MAG: hypothetical protein RIQ53_2581 [Pseudomonadota bacterium]